MTRKLVLAALNLRPEEARPAFLLIGLLFQQAAAMAIFNAIANTLFLTHFDIVALPWVFIAAAILSPPIGLAFARLGHRTSLKTLLIATIVALLAIMLTLYVAMITTGSRWVVMAMMVLKDPINAVVFVGFWTLAGRVLDVRQGKRLFGMIGSGHIVAGIVGGAAIPFLVLVLAPIELLLVVAAILIAALISLAYILKALEGLLDGHGDEEEKERLPLPQLFKQRYLALLFGFAFLTYITIFFMEFFFYGQAERQFPHEASLASFFGIFGAIAGVTTLIGNSVLSGRLLLRYGLTYGLLAVPVTLGAMAMPTALVGSLLGTGGIFFLMITTTKLFDEVLRKAVEEPALLILLQPLPPSMRVRAQAVTEIIVSPFAGGMAGMIMLLLGPLLHVGVVPLMYVMVALVAAAIIVAMVLRSEYVIALTRALSSRKIGGAALVWRDASSLDVLVGRVRSPIAGEVIFCLNQLEQIEHQSLEELLIQLLDHEQRDVRLHVLQRLEQHRFSNAAAAVQVQIHRESDPQVRGRAIRALCALADANVVEDTVKYLRDSDDAVRKGAIVGLLRSGGIDGILAAGADLNALLGSPDPVDRRIGAGLLGEVGIGGFYRPLIKLIQDDDPSVRRAAIDAAGRLGDLHLVPWLLDSLASPALQSSASTALARFGETVIPALEEKFAASGSPGVRARIVRLCKRIGGDHCRAFLEREIDIPEPRVRLCILEAVTSLGYQAHGAQRDRAIRQFRQEIEAATWALAAIVDLGGDPPVTILDRALGLQIAEHVERALLLLCYLHPARPIRLAKLQLASSQKRAYALETLDNILPRDLKVLIFPLIEDLEAVQRLARLTTAIPQEQISATARIAQVIDPSVPGLSSWTRACALYVAGKVANRNLYEPVRAALDDPAPVVRETAAWAVVRLRPGDLPNGGHGIAKIPPMTMHDGRAPVLLTIEKVIILKSVEMFSQMPEQHLAQIAGLIEEKLVPAGDEILREDDIGTSMYVVSRGKVRVHRGERELAVLGERTVFGEIAVLDPERRSASVTAIEDTMLLRLDGDDVYDLMAENVEVARDIIRALCRRMRDMTKTGAGG